MVYNQCSWRFHPALVQPQYEGKTIIYTNLLYNPDFMRFHFLGKEPSLLQTWRALLQSRGELGKSPNGYGSKFNQGTAGFSPCFRLPGQTSSGTYF